MNTTTVGNKKNTMVVQVLMTLLLLPFPYSAKLKCYNKNLLNLHCVLFWVINFLQSQSTQLSRFFVLYSFSLIRIPFFFFRIFCIFFVHLFYINMLLHFLLILHYPLLVFKKTLFLSFFCLPCLKNEMLKFLLITGVDLYVSFYNLFSLSDYVYFICLFHSFQKILN